MQQFEELMGAAATIGPAGSPLPLFYAVSQAGRAILAVNEPEDDTVFAEREHHGLTVPRDSVGDDLMTACMRPVFEKVGQFQRVAMATGSATLGPAVELGKLLASMPETGDELWNDDRWPTAVGLQPLMDLAAPARVGDLTNAQDWSLFTTGMLRVALATDKVNSAADLAAFASHYPSLATRDCRLPLLLPMQQPGRVEYWTPHGKAIEVRLSIPPGSSRPVEDHAALLDEIAPEYRWYGRRWVRPAIDGASPPPSPLMTWWAILFALSTLARYQPTAWTRALDQNSSPVAALLERSLDLALSAVPHLVFESVGLSGKGPLLLPPDSSTPPVGGSGSVWFRPDRIERRRPRQSR
jgi:hypothetical protein